METYVHTQDTTIFFIPLANISDFVVRRKTVGRNSLPSPFF